MMARHETQSGHLPDTLLAQPSNVREVHDPSDRERLIISMRKVDGTWRILSSYRDDVWWTTGAPTNVSRSNTKLDFKLAPAAFRGTLKAMMYRYMQRGCGTKRRPAGATLTRNFREMLPFLRHVEGLGISSVGAVTALACATYVHSSRAPGRLPPEGEASAPTSSGTLSIEELYKRLRAVEIIFELSQYTSDPMPTHPWPDTSADHLAGLRKNRQNKSCLTPLIHDDVFSVIFQRAWEVIQEADGLLDLRDEMQRISDSKSTCHPSHIFRLRTAALLRAGLEGIGELNTRLANIRPACYVVVASLSGCRNHELANLRARCYYSTEDEQGQRYWWMRSKSQKTYEGNTEWMIPEAAVAALRALERWAAPYQALIRREIEGYRSKHSSDVRIAEAQAHIGALFVARQKNTKLVRTLALQAMNEDLKAFAKSCGADWNLASHQFRRKFANYAARSQFGDLRYLREHFKHWSMDMTLGYALNESQEMGLYIEIQDELDDLKVGVASTWLDTSEPLAGGYGHNLVDWRSREDTITLFKSHGAMVRSIALSTPIRSNGHAWCTAQDNLCVGNDLERTRCGDGCNNAVIGRQHAPIYQGLYDQLRQLESADDIGPGGRERVKRDLNRCATVLKALGHTVSEVEHE